MPTETAGRFYQGIEKHLRGGEIPKQPQSQDGKRKMRAALLTLPTQQKQVLMLHYAEEATLREIGEVYGQTKRWAKRKIRSAKMAVAREYAASLRQ
ncbi:hypothetical protein HN935_01880 [archaeon]|jgi:DNA-directed RNA polymerase specialized sigma24 family protein|nr:hypothetical protein [archaeon]